MISSSLRRRRKGKNSMVLLGRSALRRCLWCFYPILCMGLLFVESVFGLSAPKTCLSYLLCNNFCKNLGICTESCFVYQSVRDRNPGRSQVVSGYHTQTGYPHINLAQTFPRCS
uniref:Uncharacterized protein n=1 Tax=Oryza glaberrima TaxID=4538 RepID=I1R1Q7_ORYGL